MNPEPDRQDPLARTAEVVAVIGGLSLLVAAAAVSVDAIARWLFNSPFTLISDLNKYNYAVAIASFFPLCLVGRHLLVVQLAGMAVGPRARAWLDVVGDAFTLAMFAVITWQFFRYSREVTASGLGSYLLGIPQYPWWWLTSALVAVCVPVQAIMLVRGIRKALAGTVTDAEEGEDPPLLT